jgi:nitrite reductase/ring-hydroxylating ferredoxin subunit
MMSTFQKAATIKDLKDAGLLRVDIEGKAIVLAMVQRNVYAMNAVCSHEGGPLEEGELEGNTLICPWHQGKFDIRSAKASAETDWVTDLHSYSVVVDDSTGDISVNTG